MKTRTQYKDSFAQTLLEWADALGETSPDDPQREQTCFERAMSRLGQEVVGGWLFPTNLRLALLVGMRVETAHRKEAADIIRKAVNSTFPGRVEQL